MKIAICLSGLTRYHERSLKSIKENFKEADVFAHSYNIKNLINVIKDTWSKDITKDYYETENLTTEEILLNYLPKAFKIDDYENISDFFKFIYSMALNTPEDNNLSVISMFYSIHASNNLKKSYEQANNFKYDLTIRMRYDSLLKNFIPKNFGNNFLYIPQAEDTVLMQKGKGITDQFAFGPSEIMDTYSDLFPQLIDITKKCGRLFPEQMLSHYLLKQGLSDKIKRPYVNVKISKSREWLKDADKAQSTSYSFKTKTLIDAKKSLDNTNTELFHEHDGVFIKEDETDPKILSILIFSGSQFWPDLPNCCVPGLKGLIRVDTTGEEWTILDQNTIHADYLQFLVDYMIVLSNECKLGEIQD